MITIFTPTYNRRQCIEGLKASLDRQTSYDFEWIVVDDGSSDGTEEYFKTLQTVKYPIRYYKQKNAGKHIAHNKGAKEARGDLFLCVDSDDELLPDAVRIIHSIHQQMYYREKCVGYIFPRIGDSFGNVEAWNQLEGQEIDVIDTKEIYGIIETAIVIKTDILKRHTFPRYEKSVGGYEVFCPEGILYNMLIEEGKFYAINQKIYKAEYKKDGLTKNVFQLWMDNSRGVMAALNLKFLTMKKYPIKQRIKSRIKCAININALCIATHTSVIRSAPSKIYAIFLYIPSILFARKRFKMYAK